MRILKYTNMLRTETRKITTIKLYKETKERIEKFRSYKRESYDEIMQKILEILNLSRASPERARARLIALERKKKKAVLKNKTPQEVKII